MKFPARGRALNHTRRAYLATSLAVADTLWTRFRGLLNLASDDFRNGDSLWIVPCYGVHTLGMGFAIDVVCLDHVLTVIHTEAKVRPGGSPRCAGILCPCSNCHPPPSHKRKPR